MLSFHVPSYIVCGETFVIVVIELFQRQCRALLILINMR